MQITKQIKIDMANRQLTEPAYAVQGDSNTRVISARLFENNIPWEVPTGVTAAVAFQKPDKTKGLYDHLPDGSPAISISGNVVKAILAPQVLSCSGEVRASIVFHDSDLTQLATFPFYIDVAENPASGQSVSNDYYRYSTMEEVNEAVEAALAALETEKQEFLDKAEKALADVRNALEASTPAIVCEASGEVISAADASDRPLKGLSIYGKTVQNGTPTPENPAPLESVGASGAIRVTVAGKNLFDENRFLEMGFSKVGEHEYYSNRIYASAGIIFTNTLGVSGSFAISGKLKYLDIGTGSWGLYAMIYYKDGTTHLLYPTKGIYDAYFDYAVTTNADKTVDYIAFTYGSGAVNTHVKDFQIEHSPVATAYEPYKGQTLTVSTHGGLCGIGESKDEIDFARGVRVQRVQKVVFDGTENWIKSGDGEIILRTADAPDIGTVVQCFCSHYPAVTRYLAYDNRYTVGYQGFAVCNWSYYAVDNVNCNGDNEAFKALLAQQYAKGNPVTVQYLLATPIETPLSAEELAQYAALRTNYPNTTVFNDSGAGMGLAYVADTKNYIDQKLAAISAAMLNA